MTILGYLADRLVVAPLRRRASAHRALAAEVTAARAWHPDPQSHGFLVEDLRAQMHVALADFLDHIAASTSPPGEDR